MKMVLELKCSKCYRKFQTELQLSSIGYGRGVVRCPYCNTLYHIRIEARIIRIDITPEDLDDFEQWLINEKKLVSAHQYRRQVEKYLETGEIPKKTSALNHFQEYLRKTKHQELPIY